MPLYGKEALLTTENCNRYTKKTPLHTELEVNTVDQKGVDLHRVEY